jgi:4'-phosphopantetheinyl transferase
MIYRLYYDPGSDDEPGSAHQYCELLLEHALLHEKKLNYRDQTITRNEWGKPALQDYPHIQFNLSHCRGLAACILAEVPVGIDAEYIRPYSPYAAMHALNPQELDDISRAEEPDRLFFAYWTLKESCVKAMGFGLAYSLKKVAFRIAADAIQCLTQPEFRFVLLENNSPYITAVCYQEKGKSIRICESA